MLRRTLGLTPRALLGTAHGVCQHGTGPDLWRWEPNPLRAQLTPGAAPRGALQEAPVRHLGAGSAGKAGSLPERAARRRQGRGRISSFCSGGGSDGRERGHVQRIEIHKLRQGDNLILGFSIGGGIDQDPTQNPFSEDKTDKGIYVTRVTEGGPAEIAGLQIGDKIMQVNGWDMTMVTHDQARKRLTKRNEEVVRLLVTRQSLQKAVQQSMMS
ncbi:tax1-binding protein 3 isoform X1 [Coturnix japonica]|nr:tax1-binding protein 3 isoform X1 [Coturnix japonica]